MKTKKSIATILTVLLFLLLAGCSSLKAGEIKAEEKETSAEAAKTEETGTGNAETTEAESVSEGEPFELTAAIDSGTFAYPFWVAENKGIFDKYNIQPEFQTYAYGIDTINAVTLGQADIGEAMDFAAISRLGGESQLQFISFIAGNKLDGTHLYVFGDEIKEPKDLEGKSVIVQKGTVNEYVWEQLYSQYGIDSSKVNALYISSTAEGLALVKNGDADAIWAGGDIESQVIEQGGVSIGDYSLINFAPQGFLMLKKDFIAENQEGLVRLLKALDEAVIYINENPDEAAGIVQANFGIPSENIAKALKSSNFDIRFSNEDADQLDSVTKWSIENQLVKYSFDIRDYINLDVIKQAYPERVTVGE